MAGSDSTKLLVIDDDPEFVKAVDDVLTEEGYEVLTALSGEQAMNMLKENRDIEVILLDLYMPDPSGEEILKRLRRDPDYAGMPIVIITVDRNVGKAAEMRIAGADDFIVKPVKADELASAVEKAVSSHNDKLEHRS